jgi:hypothetical protein
MPRRGKEVGRMSSALDRWKLVRHLPIPAPRVAESVRERDAVYGKPLPLGCHLTGDPPPGRSALNAQQRFRADADTQRASPRSHCLESRGWRGRYHGDRSLLPKTEIGTNQHFRFGRLFTLHSAP